MSAQQKLHATESSPQPLGPIVLCYPLFDKVFFTEPVGILSLSAYLRQFGYSVAVRDDYLFGRSCSEVAQFVVAEAPAIIGVSMTCEREYHDGCQLLDSIRGLGYRGMLVAGGDFASFHAQTLLEGAHADVVIIGEGEESFRELLDSLREGAPLDDIPGVATAKNPHPRKRAALRDLDALPFLDRSVLAQMIRQNGESLKGMQASLPTGRGCYGGCAFCSIWKGAGLIAGGAYREYGVDRILAEMAHVHSSFGVTEYYCCSAQFLSASRKRAEQRAQSFADGIESIGFVPSIFLYLRCDNVTESIASNLRRAHATTLFIGVESFDDHTLEKLNKGLTAQQIEQALTLLQDVGYSCDYRAPFRLKLGFIMFTQWTSLDGLRKNLDGCRKFGIPPKKMAYTLQVHEENDLVDAKKAASSPMDVGFNELPPEALFVREHYLRVLDQMIPALEAMRAFQKADLGLPEDVDAATWHIVDRINEYAYAAFGKLLDLAEGFDDDGARELLRETAAFVQGLDVAGVMQRVRNAAAPERLKCVESHLERGLDNPQIMPEGEARHSAAPLVGRIP